MGRKKRGKKEKKKKKERKKRKKERKERKKRVKLEEGQKKRLSFLYIVVKINRSVGKQRDQKEEERLVLTFLPFPCVGKTGGKAKWGKGRGEKNEKEGGKRKKGGNRKRAEKRDCC